LQRECRVPVLSLSFDEHTGRAGLLTRLEAFVDILERRRQRQAAPPRQKGWQGLLSFPMSGLLENLESRMGEGFSALLQALRESAWTPESEVPTEAGPDPEGEGP
jgi:hypothetical protein